MSAAGRAVARALISLRLIVIVAWIGAAIAVGVTLDPIGEGSGGTLGALVPKHAPALTAEKLSATLFEFPLVSQTVIVVRNPHGLALTRQAELVRLATRLSLGHVPGFSARTEGVTGIRASTPNSTGGLMSWLTGHASSLDHVAAKAVLMYVTAVVALRLGERRTLAQWTIIDFATAVATGAIIGRTAIAGTQSYGWAN